MSFTPKKIYGSGTPGQAPSSGSDLVNNFNDNFDSVKSDLEEKDKKIVQLEQDTKIAGESLSKKDNFDYLTFEDYEGNALAKIAKDKSIKAASYKYLEDLDTIDFINYSDKYHVEKLQITENTNDLYYRIPSIEILANDDIIMLSELRHGSDADNAVSDIIAIVSDRYGRVKKRTIIAERPDNLSNCMYPCSLRVNKRIYVFYAEKNNTFGLISTTIVKNKYVYSDDCADTWSKPIELINSNLGEVVKHMIGGSHAIIDGDNIIIPSFLANTQKDLYDLTRYFSGIYIFNTKTNTTKIKYNPTDQGASECNVVKLNDGRLLLESRDETGKRRAAYTTTVDEDTWTPFSMNAGTTTEPCQNDLIRFGNVYFLSKPTVKRGDIEVYISNDSCANFTALSKASDPGVNTRGYTSLAVDKDVINVLCEYNEGLYLCRIKKNNTTWEL